MSELFKKKERENVWEDLTPEGMSTKDYMNSKNKLGISKILNPFSKGNIQSGASSGLINAAAGAISTFGNKWLSEGYEGAGKTIGAIGSTVGGVVSNFNPLLGGAITAASGIVGGLANRFLGMKTNQLALGIANKNIQRNMSFRSNAQSFDSLHEAPGVQGHAKVYKGGHWNKSAGNKKNAALAQAEGFAALSAVNQVNSNIENLQHKQANTMLLNYSAYGGPLDGAIGYQFMSDYLNNGKLKAIGSETMTQMPNSFMNINAFGGNIETHGSNWSTGLSHINKGGTHEENPYGGVTVGHDDLGVPNMVEEGETIANTKDFNGKSVRDYVFSNRLKVPEYSKQYKKEEMPYEMKVLKKYEGKTFSKGGKMAEKRSGVDERPNDILALNMFANDAYYLMQSLEKEREKEMLRDIMNEIDMMSPNEFQQFALTINSALQGQPTPEQLIVMQLQMAMQLLPSPEELLMMMQQQGMYPEELLMSPEEEQMMMGQQGPEFEPVQSPEYMAAHGGYLYKYGGPIKKFGGGGDLISKSSFKKLYKLSGLTLPYDQAYKEFMDSKTTDDAWDWLVRNFGEDLYKDIYNNNRPSLYLKKGWKTSLNKSDNELQSDFNYVTKYSSGKDNLLNVLGFNFNNGYGNPSGVLPDKSTLNRWINRAERLYKQNPQKFSLVYSSYGVSNPLELRNMAYQYYRNADDWIKENNIDLEGNKNDYIKRGFDDYKRLNNLNDDDFDNVLRLMASSMFPDLEGYFNDFSGEDLQNEILRLANNTNGKKNNTEDIIQLIQQYSKLPESITSFSKKELDDKIKYTGDSFNDIYSGWNYGGKKGIEYTPTGGGKYKILPWTDDQGKVTWTFNGEDNSGTMKDYELSPGYLEPRRKLGLEMFNAILQANLKNELFDYTKFFDENKSWKSYINSLNELSKDYWTDKSGEFTLDKLFGDNITKDILENQQNFENWRKNLSGPLASSYWFDEKPGIAHGLASKTTIPGQRTVYFTSNSTDDNPWEDDNAIFYSDNPGENFQIIKSFDPILDELGRTTHYIQVGSPFTFDDYYTDKAKLNTNPLIWVNENSTGKLEHEDMPLPDLPMYPFLAAAGLQAGLLGYNLLDNPDLSDTARLLSMAENTPYKPAGWNNVPDTFNYRPVNARAIMTPFSQNNQEAMRLLAQLSTSLGAARAALQNLWRNNIDKEGLTIMQAMALNEENRQKAFQLSNAALLQNSEGALKADLTNAENFSKASANSLSAMNAAITNKQKILDDKSKSISSSLSGLVNILPAWAQQKYQGDMLAWGAYHNVWPGAKTRNLQDLYSLNNEQSN